MTQGAAETTKLELFQNYLKEHKAELKPQAEYYHVDVVAEAYESGFADGKISGKQDFIHKYVQQEVEMFVEKANQIYLLSKRLVRHLHESSYSPKSLYINLSFKRPRVILGVKSSDLNEDEFVELAYKRVFELKDHFHNLYNEYLDLGLVNSEDLDKEVLEEDGFGYKEIY